MARGKGEGEYGSYSGGQGKGDWIAPGKGGAGRNRMRNDYYSSSSVWQDVRFILFLHRPYHGQILFKGVAESVTINA